MILDEAVEAAAKAFYGPAYEDVAHAELKYALEQIRAAIEAAAPYLKANAWDEGKLAAKDRKATYQIERTNPYRSQA